MVRTSLGAEVIISREISQVIPSKGNIKIENDDIDWAMYRYRYLVEDAFLKIKEYRDVATRYDKLAKDYNSMVSLVFSIMPMCVD